MIQLSDVEQADEQPPHDDEQPPHDDDPHTPDDIPLPWEHPYACVHLYPYASSSRVCHQNVPYAYHLYDS